MTDDRLTPLDIATGMALPHRRAGPSRVGQAFAMGAARPDAADRARAALDRAILPGLLRPPCLVSFSGGRDSAAVLAAATSLARREGVPLPIPASNVFRSAEAANEGSYQEMLIRHLGLTEWLRLEHDQELDLIGPYAQRVLKEHGLLWPANVHFHLPLLDAAGEGSLLTGVGGDELYSATQARRVDVVLCRQERPRPRDALTTGFALAPSCLRQHVFNRRGAVEAPWLRPEARRVTTALISHEAAVEPLRMLARVGWWHDLRYLHMGARSLDRLGARLRVRVIHPLLDHDFWQSAARAAVPAGWAHRTEGVQRLFGDLLPAGIVQRSSKANFNDVFWTERARSFAREWDGAGVPEQWVDPAGLARHWGGDGQPSAQTGTLVQAAWLASTHRLKKRP